MATTPVEALIAAAEGPLALNFAADINAQFAPLVQAALSAEEAISRPILEVLLAFGWDTEQSQFQHGRPDLNALACRIKHVLLEVRRARYCPSLVANKLCY